MPLVLLKALENIQREAEAQSLDGPSAGAFNIQASSGTTGSPFITGQTLGTQRNDFSAFVGFSITVGGSNLNVTDIGRWIISGQDANSHDLKITLGATGGAWTLVTNSLVTLASGQAAGAYAYVHYSTPIVLTAGLTYNIWSNEANAGDKWYNSDTTVTNVVGGTISSASYDAGGGTVGGSGGAGNAFGPTNFKFF